MVQKGEYIDFIISMDNGDLLSTQMNINIEIVKKIQDLQSQINVLEQIVGELVDELKAKI